MLAFMLTMFEGDVIPWTSLQIRKYTDLYADAMVEVGVLGARTSNQHEAIKMAACQFVFTFSLCPLRSSHL